MATTPLVGLTTYRATASFGAFVDTPVALVMDSYYELVAQAGGRPLLLPHVRRSPAGPGVGAARVIEQLDALVVIGGLDVDPALYGQEPDPHLGTIDDSRDISELALLTHALDVDLPILAICRGHQLLNVALGGTLAQHAPDLVGHSRHQPRTGAFTHHEVACEPGTMTAEIFGTRPTVACSHHQVIDQVADGLVVTATSIEEPGVPSLIEAVERPASRFCLGVQWHPEEIDDVAPFDALVEAVG